MNLEKGSMVHHGVRSRRRRRDVEAPIRVHSARQAQPISDIIVAPPSEALYPCTIHVFTQSIGLASFPISLQDAFSYL